MKAKMTVSEQYEFVRSTNEITGVAIQAAGIVTNALYAEEEFYKVWMSYEDHTRLWNEMEEWSDTVYWEICRLVGWTDDDE